MGARTRQMVVWAILLPGCVGPGSGATLDEAPLDEAPLDEAGGPEDPRARTLGGCTATLERTEAGAPNAVVILLYDENGDLVEQDATYADGTRATWTFGYDAPHERSSARYDGEGQADDTIEHWRWEDGLRVYYGEDQGADGTIDRSYTATHDQNRLYAERLWDTDGDGEVNAVVTYDWTPDGDGWHGIGEGVYDDGDSWTEEYHADAEAWVYDYRFDRGTYHHEWLKSPRNDLGESAHTEDLVEEEGEYGNSDVLDYTLDPLGRRSGYEHVRQAWVAGEGSTLHRYSATYDYDCPTSDTGSPAPARCAHTPPLATWAWSAALVLAVGRRPRARSSSLQGSRDSKA